VEIMEDLLKVINVLKKFNIENDPISILEQVTKVLWSKDIKPTDILMAIDLIEENDEDGYDLAEEHIDQTIEDLEKMYKYRKSQIK
jgi:hypothetical protein